MVSVSFQRVFSGQWFSEPELFWDACCGMFGWVCEERDRIFFLFSVFHELFKAFNTLNFNEE